MGIYDWLVLTGTIGFILLYGLIKTRKQESLDDYILGEQSSSWWKVGLAVMATQASAITFISTTGQGFSDGMQFVQFYLGLPLAMIAICITFIPMFYKLKVLTAYEYLEQRFDLRTRTFASVIFLIQRGLAAGITLYAPSIILSSIFDWNLQWTHIISGLVVILYTVTGGSRAVTVTQLQQMAVILIGMVCIFTYILYSLPSGVGFTDALTIAGWTGKTEALSFDLDFNNRYNFWAGITGGFFLALAYFGTDQSQVQRYISGKNMTESRMGLIFNGILKIPMQVFILLTGVLLFVVFQFNQTPIHFNDKVNETLRTEHGDQYSVWMQRNDSLHKALMPDQAEIGNPELKVQLEQLNQGRTELRKDVQDYVRKHLPEQEANDRDYVFLHYILYYLPTGFIGLMIAVILSAAMSSISAEINALTGTTMVDLVKRHFPKWVGSGSEVRWSRWIATAWGCSAIGFALYASLFENLIQFINIIGSLFYGTVLGIFLSGFYLKSVKGPAVFYSALAAQLTILLLFAFTELGFLWYNVIACAIVMIGSLFLGFLSRLRGQSS
ncbi:MAG TPA: sodium:solute symporter [Saprospiraceae bacterium]|nr:sodium:solute symporter [Saprospiraceae bacterium]